MHNIALHYKKLIFQDDCESTLSGGVISWDVDGGRRSLKLEVISSVSNTVRL